MFLGRGSKRENQSKAMGAIPLPLLPPSSSPHFLLRRPISLISAATPPHISHILTTTTTSLPPFSPHFLTTFSLPHSLSASQQLAETLSDVVLEADNSKHEAENEDKVVDSDKINSSEANLLAVNPLNDVVLEDETDNYEYVAEDKDKVVDFDSKTNVLAVNALTDVVLEDESDNSAELNDVVLDDETDTSETENAVNGVVLEEEIENCDNSKTNVFVVDVKSQPAISIKEKKELASYAHSLGKKLKSQQVGKSGVTVTVITALIETLEKNELLKLKIHGNCPSEMDDAVKLVEMGTGSVAVSQIGRTVILYRPSISKLQAEQKKKEARRKLMKKRPAWVRSSSQSQEELPKLTSRGRRGSSRV